MPCPYCKSRKVEEEYTVQVYELRDEAVYINNVLCAKCGHRYTRTIRDNYLTGKSRSFTTKIDGEVDETYGSGGESPGLLARIFGRFRR